MNNDPFLREMLAALAELYPRNTSLEHPDLAMITWAYCDGTINHYEFIALWNFICEDGNLIDLVSQGA